MPTKMSFRLFGSRISSRCSVYYWLIARRALSLATAYALITANDGEYAEKL